MRLVEFLTFIIAILLLIGSFAKIKKNIINVLLVVFSTLTIIISILYGLRWTYFPLYLFLIVCILLKFKLHILSKLYKMSRRLKIASFIFLLFLILMSFSSSFIFPVYELPLPTGDYLVGTKVFDIVDTTRNEEYSEKAAKRKFKIQVWYPCESSEKLEKANWLYDGKQQSQALSKDSNLPAFALDHLAGIKSNSYVEASLSKKKKTYPVVIISHGWRSLRNLHQDMAEELASQGYIVFGIDHSYGSVKTVFIDGTSASINYDALPSDVSPNIFINKANQLVRTYSDDISKTVNYIEEMNSSDSMFSKRIDMENIGLLGHSTGGGAAVKDALRNKKIKSLIGLDAWVEPIDSSDISNGLKIPSLFLRSKQWEVGKNNINLSLLLKDSEYKPLIYQIDDTTHYDFSMVYMFTSLSKTIGLSGKIDEEHLRSILKNTITSFFNQTLREKVGSQILIDKYEGLKDVSNSF